MDTSNYIPCKISERDYSDVEQGFGVRDSKGREVGGSVSLYVETFERDTTPRQFGGRVCDPARLGVWFSARPHALRDGKCFGALQSVQRFRTTTERDAYVARYFKSAQKRAAKAAART